MVKSIEEQKSDRGQAGKSSGSTGLTSDPEKPSRRNSRGMSSMGSSEYQVESSRDMSYANDSDEENAGHSSSSHNDKHILDRPAVNTESRVPNETIVAQILAD